MSKRPTTEPALVPTLLQTANLSTQEEVYVAWTREAGRLAHEPFADVASLRSQIEGALGLAL